MKRKASSVFFRILCGIMLSVLTCSLPLSCRPGADKRQPRRDVFILRRGRFEQALGADFTQNTRLLPWPVQTRITDMYAKNGTLFCLVNNYGIAALRFNCIDAQADNADPAPSAGGAYADTGPQPDAGALDTEARPEFSYYYDPALFGGRSSGGLYALGDSLFCHVYRDEVSAAENTASTPPGLFPGPITFVRFPMDGHNAELGPSEIVSPGWQQHDPAWQAVVVNPLDGDTFALEWKRKTADRVYFHYTSYKLSNGEESEHARKWFMHSFSFDSALGGETPTRYAALFKACIRELTAADGEYLLHFTVTDVCTHGREAYAYRTAGYEQSQDGRYITIEISRNEDLLAALLPGARVLLLSRDSGEARVRKLPHLPSHCRYTDLILFQGFICASWEDIRFTRVGAAGLVIVLLGEVY